MFIIDTINIKKNVFKYGNRLPVKRLDIYG